MGVERSSKTLGSSQQRRPTRQQWRQAGSRPFVTRTTSLFAKVWTLPKPTRTRVLDWISFVSLEGPAKFGGDVRVTRIACLVRVKADKLTKVRLIVDTLRSGVNVLVIVSPRGADLASGAVGILEAWAGHWTESRRSVDEFARDGEGVEFAAVGFADAFLTMPLLEHERKYVVVKGVSNCYVFRSVAFGLTPGPLL